MHCPHCPFEQGADFVECPACGVIVAKYRRARDAFASPSAITRLSAAGVREAARETAVGWTDAAPAPAALRHELLARAVAIPSALFAARWAVSTAPGLVRLFAMWVHECGHTAAAWLCSHLAMPGPWITPVGGERSLPLTALFTAALGYGAWRAWQAARWSWVAAALGAAILLLGCTFLLRPGQVQQLIVFGGDGGCFVFGSLLMFTVYAPKESPLCQNNLRWGLVIFGALAFMDAYVVWSGSIDRIPFGENDSGLSDPSVLTEEYGWSVILLQSRYRHLATACLVGLGCVYAAGLLRPWLAARAAGAPPANPIRP